MSEKEPSVTDQILDLLLDALQERQQQRTENASPISVVSPPPQQEPPLVEWEPITEASSIETAVITTSTPTLLEEEPAKEPEPDLLEPEPVEELIIPVPEPLPDIHLNRLLLRLVGGILLVILIINIPFNRYGTSLARAMPDTAALVIRDGLLLKGSGDKVYVLEDNQLRWITTLDAFKTYGYHWEQVHEVDDKFLQQFTIGQSIHLLLKCQTSPHVYALEDDKKRWIKDIPTFVSQGYIWEDVQFVGCDYLRQLPDGPPIPLDAGPPPQP